MAKMSPLGYVSKQPDFGPATQIEMTTSLLRYWW